MCGRRGENVFRRWWVMKAKGDWAQHTEALCSIPSTLKNTVGPQQAGDCMRHVSFSSMYGNVQQETGDGEMHWSRPHHGH
jgi:hypothetical protein